jgi:hypothetical protein
MTTQRMCIACLITKATDTQSELWNSYCSSTATMVARKRLSATSYVHAACLANSPNFLILTEVCGWGTYRGDRDLCL